MCQPRWAFTATLMLTAPGIWSVAANSNPYSEALWPANYSGRNAPYPSEDSDPAIVPLQVLLEAKQRAIADLEEFRQRRLTELHTLLAEQQKTYGPSHPAIADTKRSIEAVSGASPQIAALKSPTAERTLNRPPTPSGTSSV